MRELGAYSSELQQVALAVVKRSDSSSSWLVLSLWPLISGRNPDERLSGFVAFFQSCGLNQKECNESHDYTVDQLFQKQKLLWVQECNEPPWKSNYSQNQQVTWRYWESGD